MKLKTIVILFNVLIIAAFFGLAVVPYILLGPSFSRVFWHQNWFIPILFVLILAVLNGFFFFRRRVFIALAGERWDEVADELLRQLQRRRRVSPGDADLLAHALVVTGRTEQLSAVETALEECCPKLAQRYRPVLAVPWFLSQDGPAREEYFARHRSTGDPWMQWGYAFSLLLQQRHAAAAQELQALHGGSVPVLLQGVALYLRSYYLDQETGAERHAFAQHIPHRKWRQTLEREKTFLPIVIMTTLLQNVEAHIYGEYNAG